MYHLLQPQPHTTTRIPESCSINFPNTKIFKRQNSFVTSPRYCDENRSSSFSKRSDIDQSKLSRTNSIGFASLTNENAEFKTSIALTPLAKNIDILIGSIKSKLDSTCVVCDSPKSIQTAFSSNVIGAKKLNDLEKRIDANPVHVRSSYCGRRSRTFRTSFNVFRPDVNKSNYRDHSLESGYLSQFNVLPGRRRTITCLENIQITRPPQNRLKKATTTVHIYSDCFSRQHLTLDRTNRWISSPKRLYSTCPSELENYSTNPVKPVSSSRCHLDCAMPNAGLENIYSNFNSTMDGDSKQPVPQQHANGCSAVVTTPLKTSGEGFQRKTHRSVSTTGVCSPTHYFRIQIPSTKATSRAKGFTMTDSLKLYEEQIFSHYDASQRPQSWCIDYEDEQNGDRISDGSPASTVCSSFSSSSSSESPQLVPVGSCSNRKYSGGQLKKECAVGDSPLQLQNPSFPLALNSATTVLDSSKDTSNHLTDASTNEASTPTTCANPIFEAARMYFKTQSSEQLTAKAFADDDTRHHHYQSKLSTIGDSHASSSSGFETVRPIFSSRPVRFKSTNEIQSNGSGVAPLTNTSPTSSPSVSTSSLDGSLPILPPPPGPWSGSNRGPFVDNNGGTMSSLNAEWNRLTLDSLTADTYAFSSLDSDYIGWMRLNVRDVTGQDGEMGKSSKMLIDLDAHPRTHVHHWVDVFNSNPFGLRLNFVDDSCRLAGTLRVYINLIKPVKMSLRRSMDMTPQSAISNCDNFPDKSMPTPSRLVSFLLPRGTSKVVFVMSSTTSANAIQSLLDRFHIQESSRRFSLFEHTLENNTVVVRKLDCSECPLLVLLNWVRLTSNRDEFCALLKRKRIVLQEDDSYEFEWKDFSIGELNNFLRILDKEELEYQNSIILHYNYLREFLEAQMNNLTNPCVNGNTATGDGEELQTNYYQRYYSSSHPLALDTYSKDAVLDGVELN